MADGRIVIDVDLNDKNVSSELKNLESTLKGLSGLSSTFKSLSNATNTFGKSFSSLSGIMGTTAAKATAGLATIVVGFNKLYEASKQNFFENLSNIGNTLKPAINVVKDFSSEVLQAFSSITGFEFSFSSMIESAVEFESKMAQVSAIMNVTGDGISELTSKAREYGATTRYTASEVADAFSYMGMAGWSAQESLSGISAVLNLATIGGTELATTSDIVTDGLTALSMSASQAGNFVDYMAATITRSNTNVEMMGESLKYVGSVAGTLGINMQDLSVALGLMANNGIKASQAGTSLRGLLANLSAPTESVASAMSKYGISLVTASDGTVDLDATLKSLRESLKGLPLVEQAEACKKLAGKTGMAGLMAIVNATDEEYQALTDSISNATEQVNYWNENCAVTGKTGQEAVDAITKMKEAYEGSETSAQALNLTTQDLALAVQLLGADADVTADNVTELLNVFSSLKSPTEQQASTMKKLGLTYHEVNDSLFDYSKTCAAVDSSILGLSNAQKEQIKSLLSVNMTMEEANKVLKQYGLEAQSASTGQIDFISNLQELRNTFGGMSESARAAALEQLGLGSAIEEVNEMCNMSQEEFDLYCKNLELATGLSEKLAQAMDETTKGSLLTLASALTDVGLAAFEKFKEGLVGVSDVLTEFFETWRGQDFSYTFDNFKLACDGLLESVRNMDLSGAMGEAIDGMVNFISNGGLGGVLSIGGEIVTQICEGITSNKGNIEVGVSEVINQIATWISANAPQIGEAGNTILNAISKGITDNKDSIRGALEAVTAVMDTWVISSASIQSLCSNFADIFIESFASQMASKATLKMGEIGNGIITSLVQSLEGAVMGMGEVGMNIFEGIRSWLFPEAHATGEETGAKIAEGTIVGVDANGKYIYDTANSAGQQAGQGIVDGAEEGVAPLSTVMQLQEATRALQQSATDMYNGAKVSFAKLSDVGKEAMTSLYQGASNSLSQLESKGKQAMTNLYNGAGNSLKQLAQVGKQAATDLYNGATTSFTQLESNGKQAMTNLYLGVQTSFTTMSTSCVAIAKNMGSQVTTALNSCASEAYSAGYNIGIGLKNGINASGSQAVAAAKNIANQVASAMRSALDIHSPSRVTQEIGKFVSEGLAVGIANNSDSVKNATSKITNMVKDEVAKIKAELEKDTDALDLKLDGLRYEEEDALRSLRYKEEDALKKLKEEEENKLAKTKNSKLKAQIQKEYDAKETALRREYDALETALKREFDAKEKAIKDAIEQRKNQANAEIDQLNKVSDAAAEALKKELQYREDFADKVNDLQKALVSALKEKYAQEYEAQKESLEKQLSSLDKWKEESIKRINSVYDAKIKAIDAELKALEEVEKQNDRLKEDKEYEDKISKLETAIEFEHDETNKAQLEKELQKVLDDRSKMLEERALEDKKQALKDKKEELEEKRKNELEYINGIYESEKESYNTRLSELKKYYDDKTEQAKLQAEAEKLILDKNQKEMVDLINSYAPEWKDAGKTLGDSLADGVRPAIDDIKAMMDSIWESISSAQSAAKNIGRTGNIYSTNNTVNNNSTRSFNINVNGGGSESYNDIEVAMRKMAFTIG